MPSNYTPVDADHATITVPVDGDRRNAASVATGLEQLADNIAHTRATYLPLAGGVMTGDVELTAGARVVDFNANDREMRLNPVAAAVGHRKLVDRLRTGPTLPGGAISYARTFTGPGTNGQFETTQNASWDDTAGQWSYDYASGDGNQGASRIIQSGGKVIVQAYTGASPWNEAAWVTLSTTSGLPNNSTITATATNPTGAAIEGNGVGGGPAVRGFGDTTGYGIFGESGTSAGSAGVKGAGQSGSGASGVVGTGDGAGDGVKGTSGNNSTSAGVVGTALGGSNAHGVIGTGDGTGNGVKGTCAGAGNGVRASNSGSGAALGVSNTGTGPGISVGVTGAGSTAAAITAFNTQGGNVIEADASPGSGYALKLTASAACAPLALGVSGGPPTTAADGDIYTDGTILHVHLGGVWRQIALV